MAVFSVADAVLFRPPAFPNPERVVAFGNPISCRPGSGASPVMYEHWRAQTSVVYDVAAFRNGVVNETSGTTPDQLRAALVTAAYFRLFGATVARGRTFTEDEDRPGGDRLVVISHHLWMQAFGGADIAGRVLRLNGVAHAVIGVLDPQCRTISGRRLTSGFPCNWSLKRRRKDTFSGCVAGFGMASLSRRHARNWRLPAARSERHSPRRSPPPRPSPCSRCTKPPFATRARCSSPCWARSPSCC